MGKQRTNTLHSQLSGKARRLVDSRNYFVFGDIELRDRTLPAMYWPFVQSPVLRGRGGRIVFFFFSIAVVK